MNQPITVYSTWGHFSFDKATGVCFDINLDSGDANCGFGTLPARVDVPELLANHSVLRDSYDILDIGFWDVNGDYEPPCHDWRIERDGRRKTLS